MRANVFFRDTLQRRAAVIVLALMWLIPYLAVRTSCESLSCDFIAGRHGSPRASARRKRDEKRGFPLLTLAIAGFCFGLAFEFRAIRIAFAVAGNHGMGRCSYRAKIAGVV